MLKRKILTGLFWISFSNYTIQIFRFISSLGLAKLLTPEDFGLVSLASIFLTFVSLFKDMGLNTALIQTKNSSKRMLNSTFTIVFLISIILYIITYFSAPLFASFFQDGRLIFLIRIMGISLLISASSAISSTVFQKNMEFKKMVMPDLYSSLVYIVLALILAYYGFGVYSIIYASLFSSAVGSILYLWISPYKPQFGFDLKIAGQLFKFGKYVTASYIIIFLFTNLDNVFIGKLLGMKSLGYYSFAYSIAYLIPQNLTFLISRVTFPAFSIIQDDISRLKDSYLKIIEILAIFAIPATFLIVLLVPAALKLFYVDKWVPSILCLQILAIYGLVVSIYSPAENILLATGHSNISFISNLVKLITVLPFIQVVALSSGIIGVSLLFTMSMFITVIIYTYYINKILNIKLKEFLLCFIFPVSAVMIGGLCLLAEYILHIYLPMLFITIIFLFLFIYPLFLYRFNHIFRDNFKMFFGRFSLFHG